MVVGLARLAPRAHQRQDPGVLPIQAIALTLIAAAGDCLFVTNTRTLVLPTCDIGPATIERLREEAAPEHSVEKVRLRAAGRYHRGMARPSCTTVVRGNEELERRLEVAELERVSAEVARLSAEEERDRAIRQRDQALSELKRARSGQRSATRPPLRGGEGIEARHSGTPADAAAPEGAPARLQAGG